jgi:uncharacterized membrane protein YdfJ with MMPL/SSD domain
MLKTIIITIITTLTVATLAASLFLNTIIGAFGRAAIPLATLVQLQASQKIVDTMKARHLRKQTRITKRFIKRSGRRVASAALAAATFGTVVVAAAMTAVGISDYCNEKKELQEEANILYGTAIKFDLDQCLEESAEDAKAIIDEATDTVATKVSDAFDFTADYGN